MKEDRLITIKKELEATRNYIELENIRFNDRIVSKENIENELQNFLIPKFSIQLLVENAIKHGFKNQKSEFTINIDIKHKSNLFIVVKNSGKIDDEWSKGVGLKNLEERVKLLCSGKVYLQSKNPTAFCIEMKDCSEYFSS